MSIQNEQVGAMTRPHEGAPKLPCQSGNQTNLQDVYLQPRVLPYDAQYFTTYLQVLSFSISATSKRKVLYFFLSRHLCVRRILTCSAATVGRGFLTISRSLIPLKIEIIYQLIIGFIEQECP